MTIVKICGITNVGDAELALAAGADLIGFICYAKSPRYVTPAQITTILSVLRPTNSDFRAVGVFVDASFETVNRVLDQTGLDLAQLHGGESPAFLEQLAGRGFKALRPVEVRQAQIDAERYNGLGPKAGPDLLVDAYHPAAYGGTGHRADWDIAADLARSYRLMLAGGLQASNVAEAIARVQPWGVDVSSGVEAEPGRKDPEIVRAFVAAAKAVTYA